MENSLHLFLNFQKLGIIELVGGNLAHNPLCILSLIQMFVGMKQSCLGSGHLVSHPNGNFTYVEFILGAIDHLLQDFEAIGLSDNDHVSYII